MSASPDFIFAAAEHIAGWLDGAKAGADLVAADDAFQVEGAEPKKLPAVLVYPLREDTDANLAGQAASPVQRAVSEIGILHIVAAPNRPAGRGSGSRRIRDLVDCTRRIVNLDRRGRSGPEGPIPDADTELTRTSGELADINNGRIYWLDSYSIEWTLDAQTFRGGKTPETED